MRRLGKCLLVVAALPAVVAGFVWEVSVLGFLIGREIFLTLLDSL